jgi:hypothetical protein
MAPTFANNDMPAHKNPDPQPTGGDALFREFERQIARVGVDPQKAFPRLHEIEAPVIRRLSDDTWEESLTIDASGIVETLRALPDNAGTTAFVEAYNATHVDFRDRPYNER